MKWLMLSWFGLPIVCLAQVGVGDLNVYCSGYNVESFNLTKSGRHASYNGVAMTLGRDGLYRTPTGAPISIRVYVDRSVGVTIYPAAYPGNPVMVSGRAVCSGEAHPYRLQYDRHGFPIRPIIPSDTQLSNRYRDN